MNTDNTPDTSLKAITFFIDEHTPPPKKAPTFPARIPKRPVIPSLEKKRPVTKPLPVTPPVTDEPLMENGIEPVDDGMTGRLDIGEGKAVEEAEELPPVFYDTQKNKYLVRNEIKGRWQTFNREQIKIRLRASGYPSRASDGERVSDADSKLIEIEDENDVDFSGKLAGHREGYFEANGIRGVVTESFSLVEPVKGTNTPTIDGFIRGLLSKGEEGLAQLVTFIGWLKTAYESLSKEQMSPGQALIIAGEQGAGKSQLQKFITLVLGGRQCSAANYMTGRTNFNADICQAEHLILDDENQATDIKSRLELAANIKKHCVGNNVVQYHSKGRDGFSISPWWRLSVSLNDNLERLLALPPLDDDLADKVILLKAFKQPIPFIDGTPEGYTRLWQEIERELPVYLHSLLTYQIPKEYHCDRYRIKSFHNSELAAALAGISPQRDILNLIDDYFWTSWPEGIENHGLPTEHYWQGTAAQLRKIFIEDKAPAHIRRQFNEAVRAVQTLGKFLGRLEESNHEEEAGRVFNRRSSTSREWRIYRTRQEPEPADPQPKLLI